VAWHAVLLVLTAVLGVVVTASAPVDANIGAGLVVVMLIVMGLPWSAIYWIPDLTGAWALTATVSVSLTACAAMLNLALHAIVVARKDAKRDDSPNRSKA
jgi:hypothetical protein